MTGTLEFYDVNELTLMNIGEHFTATDVEWDPSGRYIATSVSWWAQKVTRNCWFASGFVFTFHP